MPLEVTKLKREFSFEKDGKTVKIPDPNPQFTVEEVLKFYSGTYPELTNGVIDGPKVVGDRAQYKMNTKAGKLG